MLVAELWGEAGGSLGVRGVGTSAVSLSWPRMASGFLGDPFTAQLRGKVRNREFLWLCGWALPGTQRFNLDSTLTRFLSPDRSPPENGGLVPVGTQCGGRRVCLSPGS